MPLSGKVACDVGQSATPPLVQNLHSVPNRDVSVHRELSSVPCSIEHFEVEAPAGAVVMEDAQAGGLRVVESASGSRQRRQRNAVSPVRGRRAVAAARHAQAVVRRVYTAIGGDTGLSDPDRRTIASAAQLAIAEQLERELITAATEVGKRRAVLKWPGSVLAATFARILSSKNRSVPPRWARYIQKLNANERPASPRPRNSTPQLVGDVVNSLLPGVSDDGTKKTSAEATPATPARRETVDPDVAKPAGAIPFDWRAQLGVAADGEFDDRGVRRGRTVGTSEAVDQVRDVKARQHKRDP